VTSFGADALVEEPGALREAVIRRLHRLAGMTGAPVERSP